MAAQLEGPDTRVEMRPGRFGELSVTVDGEKVYPGRRFWFPRPARVLAVVRERLAARRPSEGGAAS